MTQVLILMGSDSDAEVMSASVDALTELGITSRMTVASAHRSPARVLRLVEEAIAGRVKPIPAQRLGNADEFGSTCAFLCSAHAGYITGQNVLMDGGAYPGTF